jgi:hypothetical protein
MIMGPTGLETKNFYAGEDQQHFNQPPTDQTTCCGREQITLWVPTELKTVNDYTGEASSNILDWTRDLCVVSESEGVTVTASSHSLKENNQ